MTARTREALPERPPAYLSWEIPEAKHGTHSGVSLPLL
jgi:hypothetical protein